MLEAESHPVPSSDEPADKALFPLTQMRISRTQCTTTAQFSDYFKFVFVRNPWARLVSCYCDKRSRLNRGTKVFHFRDMYMYLERMSFADFVRFVCRVPDDLCDPHFKPQSAFFDAAEVDFVGRIERFSEDLTQVIERAGLDEGFYKWCNVRRNPQRLTKADNDRYYIDFYDAKTRRLVAAKYKSDIERFGYRFGE